MSRLRRGIPAAGIFVLALFFNIWNIGFPLGYHRDEENKVGFIRTGTQDFKHPVLLLQLGRVASAVSGAETPQAVVVASRSASALLSAATCVLVWLLAARLFRPAVAVAVACGVAVSPTLVVHAHYLKEDALLTALLMATLVAFIRFADDPRPGTAAWLGVALGLAGSTHYKAALVVPLLAAAPILGVLTVAGRPALTAGRFYRLLLMSGGVAAGVWAVVNWPAFTAPSLFWEGVTFEFTHAVTGHDIPISGKDYWLGFHFIHSLGPGMTWTAVFAGVAGLFLTGWRWKLEPFQNRFLAAFAVLFYVVPEMSPLKPFPDFSRYVMPVVPVLIYFAGRLVAHAAAARPTMAAAILAGAVVAWPAYVSIRFVDEIGSDTRSRAAAWLREHNGKAVVEYYAGLAGPGQVQIEWATDLDLAEARAQGVDYIVTSSFTHGRYDFTARWPDLSNDVRTKKERYDQLFALPFEEFVPRYRTFAFSNPVVRIVKLRGAP